MTLDLRHPTRCMFLTSAHDSCVVENSEYYSPVELWQSVKQEQRHDRVYARIQTMLQMERADTERRNMSMVLFVLDNWTGLATIPRHRAR